MLEQGLVQLVQGNAAVSAIALTGGFFAELPKDQPLPSWSYRVVSNVSHYGLDSKPGLNMTRVQIDCYGPSTSGGAALVIQLARAIDALLSGYTGVLTDPDQTGVDSILQSDMMDFFDDAGRTHRRMLEYEVWWYQA